MRLARWGGQPATRDQERALALTNVATLILISAYQTPEQIRASGRDQLIAHLRPTPGSELRQGCRPSAGRRG